MKRLLMIACLLLTQAGCGDHVDSVSAKIKTAKATIPLTLELASTEKKREKGLMNRESLAPYDGMIFIFEKPEPVAFWMKDTLIPLDMLFIDSTGKIVRIAPNAEPRSLTAIPSGVPVAQVIEIIGGRSAKDGIKVGDRVTLDLPKDIYVE